MDLLPFPGADRVLARHREALPQPDQLCGPFSAHVALHALLEVPPPVTALAVAAGTRVFASDVAEWRPPGAPLDTSGWGVVPHAATRGESGTDAVGLRAGVATTTPVEVVAARDLGPDGLRALLLSLAGGPRVGVVANVRTGALDPAAPFDVGHFVVLHGVSPDGSEVGVADTYAELGHPGEPAGCRVVSTEALHAGLSAPPGRGLLLLTAAADAGVVRRCVAEAGGSTDLWST